MAGLVDSSNVTKGGQGNDKKLVGDTLDTPTGMGDDDEDEEDDDQDKDGSSLVVINEAGEGQNTQQGTTNLYFDWQFNCQLQSIWFLNINKNKSIRKWVMS